MSEAGWWFVRTYEDRTETEDRAQTQYENDADSFRKGES